MATNTIVQKEFVRRVLNDEAARFEKNQGLQMKKLLHFHTNQLYADRQFEVTSSDVMDGKLTFRHRAYERFLDIKKRGGRIRKRKTYPIHNKFVFGHYYSIARRLMFELTDDVVAGIKQDLQIKH